MSRALPPVGWQSIIEHEPHSTVVCACEKTVVMLKQPGHLTSMKNEFGDCTRRLSLCFRFSSLAEGWRRSRTMVVGGFSLLGTCVGFQGSVFCSAGGEVSRVMCCGPRRAPTCFMRLRWPAVAVGHGFVARGRPPRRFFELLKSCLQKLVLAVSTTARHALAQAVRPAVARRDASVVSALVSTSSAIYGLNWSSSPRQAANSSAVQDSRKRRSPSLPTSSWTASRRESFQDLSKRASVQGALAFQ